MKDLKVKDLNGVITSASLCDVTPCVLWDSIECEVIQRSWTIESITSPERKWANRIVDRVYATRDPESEHGFVMVISVK